MFWHFQMMRRHLQRRHPDQIISDVRSFIETLSIRSVKIPGSHSNQQLTVASSLNEDVEDIQEMEVPLSISAEDSAAMLESSCCPPAFLFIDSSCLQNCIE